REGQGPHSPETPPVPGQPPALLPAGHLPQPRGVVFPATGEHPAVAGEGQDADPAAPPARPQELLPRRDVPEADGVGRPRQQPPRGGESRRGRLGPQPPEPLAVGDAPEARPGAAPHGDEGAVRREGTEARAPVLLDLLPPELPQQSPAGPLPDPHQSALMA